jgi:hypothetical protein
MLTGKITFLLNNKKIRNLLIIVIVAFSIVGVLRYLDLYEGMKGDIIAVPLVQTSDKTLLEKIDKTTENTNTKLNEMDKKVDKLKTGNSGNSGNSGDLVIEKEQI